MSKRKIYFILGRTAWMLALGGLVFLLFSGMQQRRQTSCAGVVVNIASMNGKIFIDDKEVKNILTAELGSEIAKSKENAFDLRKMEARLRKEVWIRDAQLFFDNTGMLHANIEERVPVARVFDVAGASYYLDTAAMQLPLSITDRADLPVFTNMPVKTSKSSTAYNRACREVIDIAMAINADDFWKAQTAQIDLVANRKYELFPAVGFHVVELGRANDISGKLLRLKTFYRRVLSKKRLDSYDRLSVAYKNQVVAVAGDTSRQYFNPEQAMQVFNELVIQSKEEINANAIESNKRSSKIVVDADNVTRVPVVKKAPQPAVTPVATPPVAEPAKKDEPQPKPKAVMPPKTSFN